MNVYVSIIIVKEHWHNIAYDVIIM